MSLSVLIANARFLTRFLKHEVRNRMLKGQGFEILVADDPSHERLVAEIYYNGKYVALVNDESGNARFELETPGLDLVESEVLRKVEVRGFVEAIGRACERLTTK